MARRKIVPEEAQNEEAQNDVAELTAIVEALTRRVEELERQVRSLTTGEAIDAP